MSVMVTMVVVLYVITLLGPTNVTVVLDTNSAQMGLIVMVRCLFHFSPMATCLGGGGGATHMLRLIPPLEGYPFGELQLTRK